jgi:hypothetical protein
MKTSEVELRRVLKNCERVGNRIVSDCPNPKCGKPKAHFYLYLESGYSCCNYCNYTPKLKDLLNKKLPETILSAPNNISHNISPTATLPTDFRIITRQDKMYRYLVYSRNISEDQIEEYKIGVAEQMYPDRIIIPIENFGKLEMFSIHRKGDNMTPWDNWATLKGRVLFNLEKASVFNECILVEGIFDVLSTHIPNMVALLFSAITSFQMQRLFNYFNKFIIWLDPDTWSKQGRRKSKIEEVFHKLKSCGKKVWIVDNKDDLKDPSSIGKDAFNYLEEKELSGKIRKWI